MMIDRIGSEDWKDMEVVSAGREEPSSWIVEPLSSCSRVEATLKRSIFGVEKTI